MTSVRSELARLAAKLAPEDAGRYPADVVLAPATLAEAATVFELASRHRVPVLLWGAGTHQDMGHDVAADVVVTTARLNEVVEWQPEDLTLVVEAGVTLGAIEQLLEARRQTAVLPEDEASSSIGGIVASGRSGWRRLRYGPTRDRVLEVTLATGDGRVVRAGGRVVKNVTGYDIPRLATGSLGSLGLIGSLCIKLWPRPAVEATVATDDPHRALAVTYRPLAILETDDGGGFVYLEGTEAEVAAQAAAIGGDRSAGLAWPQRRPGTAQVEVRVPPALTEGALERVRGLPRAAWTCAWGVGRVVVDLDEPDSEALLDLRGWAESVGGSLVVVRGRDRIGLDPWGAPPGSLGLQRRVKEAFDPAGVVNPGRLPGGL